MIIADFHIHSKYSRATAKDMDLEHLEKWAEIKGIKVLGTGDFTHPAWIKSIQNELNPAEEGLFKRKGDTRFILTSEISCIYKKNDRVRKIHIIVFAPSIETVLKINEKLGSIGNIKSDGRPILGLDAKELAKIILDIDDNCLIIPAHAWTPWFSIFGSKSGFDSIEECFDEYSKYIYAIETGLSSDPKMNWRLSQLDNITLISNSDCHSPSKIGREANVFDCDLSYKGLTEAIKTRKNFLYTIEFFPEEGKYHLDGHRACDVKTTPSESRKFNNICPVCGKPLTIGVLNRVEELADREEEYVLKNAVPFKNLIPLIEIISASIGLGVSSKAVVKEYDKLVSAFAKEFDILLNIREDELKKVAIPHVAEGIIRVRNGKVGLDAGYDGVYGKIKIFGESEKLIKNRQNTLL